MAATFTCFSTSIINKDLSRASQELSIFHNSRYPKPHNHSLVKIIVNQSSSIIPRATLDKDLGYSEPPVLQEVVDSVKILKNAAKTRKVAADKILAALSVIKSTKLDSISFLDTLGGTESPGRTWMLIFTAKVDKTVLKSGSYFPITAVQRFDAAAKKIENGVFFGPIGYLTFEGRFSWKKKILAFVFESIKIKVGPFDPLQIGLGQKDEREPSTSKDPFFIWLYIDEEIAVAQGRGGGIAFWCRCSRITEIKL